jgi:hypothetical protein
MSKLTDSQLQIIADHFNSTKGKFTTGAELFSKLGSKLGCNVEGTFRAEFSKAVSSGRVSGLVGIRKKGYTTNSKVVVLEGSETVSAPVKSSCEPEAEPKPKQTKEVVEKQAKEVVDSYSSLLRYQQPTQSTGGRKIRYAWIGRECYSYLPYMNHLVEFLMLFCKGVEDASGNIVISGKRYNGDAEACRKLLRSGLFGGRLIGHCDPHMVPDPLLAKEDLIFDIAS